MSAVKIALLVGGAAFEFGGIIAIVFPDLVPYGILFGQWQRKLGRTLLDHIRRILRRPRNVVIRVGTASEVNLAGESVSLMKSASVAATLEQKVEFLLTRDQEAQRDVNILRQQIKDLEVELLKRLDQLRREIEARFSRELEAALDDYRPLRIWGAVALLLGLACVTYANFIN
jgi:hypothetical protein